MKEGISYPAFFALRKGGVEQNGARADAGAFLMRRMNVGIMAWRGGIQDNGEDTEDFL